MHTFAAVFARAPEGWSGAETPLDEAEDVADVADLMRGVAAETAGDPVLLLVEENDDWFGVLRMDAMGEPRAYVSAVRDDGLGALFRPLFEDVPVGSAGGDPAVLRDLGVDPVRLGDLADRALPGDPLGALAELAGFADEFDRLRDA
ncbi:putative tRNA adenosine deaminase-associated protein [Actinomadura rubteroloni]|uniref:Putative tRNA adenosine deaminase-associated protein n=1 Tax=Actinomadura rubteroloni TaxID=1926885 RepID=A0A2P4UMT5_9ACTN|nr:hypothetical protein [Actinomadura rubteroloni]POM26358.1 putative tRNA adenosine deaminase-associated protein [Actinomadura rubteroloni]